MKRIMYHASHCDNLSSIQDKGLRPRREEDANNIIDSILAEYGYTREDVPTWRWKYPLRRLLDTVGEVYLTGDPMYALQNCLAGYEGEAALRSNIESFRAHKRRPPLETEDILKQKGQQPLCGICQVEVDDQSPLFKELHDRWQAMDQAERDRRGHKTEAEYFDYLLKEGITLVSEQSIPPEKIKGCGCIGPSAHILTDRETYAKRRKEIYQELGLPEPPPLED